MAHLEQPPPRVTDVVPGLPPALDWVIATAMAKNPAQRFQSGADLAAAATAALAGQLPTVALGAAPTAGVDWSQRAPGQRTMLASSAVPPAIRPMPARRRNRWWLIAAGVAVALVVAGTVTAVVVSRPDESTSAAPTSASSTVPTPKPVPVADLKGLLLTTDEVSKLMGVPMNAEPLLSRMGNDARFLEQKECAGMWGPGQQLAYAGSGYLGTAAQGFSAPGTGTPPLEFQTYQAVVGFPAAASADKYFEAQTQQWKQCANRTMTFSPRGQPIAIIQGDVTETGIRTITSIQTLEGAQNWMCGRALAVRNNVTIDTFACSPANAVDQAVAVVNAIAERIPNK
jgi:hypothetical protein